MIFMPIFILFASLNAILAFHLPRVVDPTHPSVFSNSGASPKPNDLVSLGLGSEDEIAETWKIAEHCR